MAIKLKLPDRRAARPSGKSSRRSGKTARVQHFSLGDPAVKIVVAAFLVVAVVFMSVFAYFYIKYERLVDRRMAGGVFSNAAKIYARPRVLAVGEKVDAAEIAADLRRAGYSEVDRNGQPIAHEEDASNPEKPSPKAGARAFRPSAITP